MTLAETFCRALQAVDVCAERVATAAAFRDRLAALLSALGARNAVAWRHPALAALDLDAALAEAGVALLDSAGPQRLRTAAAAADVGITWTDLAVADSGTLVLCSGPGKGRVTSLLPPVHIAVVPEHCLVPDLSAALARIAALDPKPAAVNFITGPSSSGDIEMEQVTGVHGPTRVLALVVSQAALQQTAG